MWRPKKPDGVHGDRMVIAPVTARHVDASSFTLHIGVRQQCEDPFRPGCDVEASGTVPGCIDINREVRQWASVLIPRPISAPAAAASEVFGRTPTATTNRSKGSMRPDCKTARSVSKETTESDRINRTPCVSICLCTSDAASWSSMLGRM